MLSYFLVLGFSEVKNFSFQSEAKTIRFHVLTRLSVRFFPVCSSEPEATLKWTPCAFKCPWNESEISSSWAPFIFQSHGGHATSLVLETGFQFRSGVRDQFLVAQQWNLCWGYPNHFWQVHYGPVLGHLGIYVWLMLGQKRRSSWFYCNGPNERAFVTHLLEAMLAYIWPFFDQKVAFI